MTEKLPILVDAGLFRDILHVVAMHREMCETALLGGTTPPKKLRADLQAAEVVLKLLKGLEPSHRLDAHMQARFAAILAGLPQSSLDDPGMVTVRHYIEYREYGEAVSCLCAIVAKHGDYGTVRGDLLALAAQMGEHDFTPDSPIPY